MPNPNPGPALAANRRKNPCVWILDNGEQCTQARALKTDLCGTHLAMHRRKLAQARMEADFAEFRVPRRLYSNPVDAGLNALTYIEQDHYRARRLFNETAGIDPDSIEPSTIQEIAAIVGMSYIADGDGGKIENTEYVRALRDHLTTMVKLQADIADKGVKNGLTAAQIALSRQHDKDVLEVLGEALARLPWMTPEYQREFYGVFRDVRQEKLNAAVKDPLAITIRGG